MNSEHQNFRTRKPLRVVAIAACATAVLAMPTTALGGGGGIGTGGGGETTSGDKAKLRANGTAIAPASAPRRVKAAIEAANRIEDKPYRLGGGHGSWNDSGYDCSGAVSYTLGPKGAGLIDSPMASGGFVNWGSRGKGKWITTYANSGHMFVVIAGLRFDTAATKGDGPSWSRDVRAGMSWSGAPDQPRHKGNL